MFGLIKKRKPEKIIGSFKSYLDIKKEESRNKKKKKPKKRA